MRRIMIVVCAAGALSLCVLVGSPQVFTTLPPAGETIGANVENVYGERIWYGEMSEAVSRAADAAEAVASDMPELVAGVALTSDRKVVEVYAVQPDDDRLSHLVATYPHEIRVVHVSHSADELDAAVRIIADLDWAALGIVSVAPDPIHDGIVVGINGEKITNDLATSLDAVIRNYLGNLTVNYRYVSNAEDALAENSIDSLP